MKMILVEKSDRPSSTHARAIANRPYSTVKLETRKTLHECEVKTLVKVMFMTIRETAIAKLHQLPEPLLQEISDFIDFIIHKHQPKPVDRSPENPRSETWAEWFKEVDRLEVTPTKPTSEYKQHLIHKYQQQGLDL